ncbi:NAD-dependent epimerase/dehydratase family protein [Azospirillum sp. TSA6c]|uniref:NAD-dependent epimerase/dehydratase family protein n=1 Tax=unclassified Azospirillum TaxID=2630922 RepID=UPI000D6033D6|nr:NAD-dependent epimerase/dehydratase family protein [Azospirillum sp. TSA6c]PWC54230.1 NAD-dependent epimerase [Azospirillum sp. TSA6c]
MSKIDKMAGKRVLITGGLGFIGANLAIRLVEEGADVLLVDSLIPLYGGMLFNIQPVRDRVRVNISDLRDRHSLPALVKDRDIIFNLAGQTSHMDSMEDPFTDLDINCASQLSLLEVCRQCNPEVKLVFASTRQLYGRPQYLPVDESHPIVPVDVNGINKAAGEFYHILYNNVYGIRSVVLRLTNVYGPRMRIKDARQTFLGIWIRQALEGRPIEVWEGAQKRDFNYVEDVIDALIVAASNEALNGGTFNIGGSEVISLREVADLIVRNQPGATYEIKEFPASRKKIDIGDYYTNSEKFSGATGWAPRIGLADGIMRTMAYYRDNLSHYI